MEDKIGGVQWVLEGFRLLIFVGTDLVLYQDKIISCSVAINRPIPQNNDIKFCLNSEEASLFLLFFKIIFKEIKWEVIWRIKLANKVKHVRFSNDGTLFATCGAHDPFVKIWYQLKGFFSVFCLKTHFKIHIPFLLFIYNTLLLFVVLNGDVLVDISCHVK